MRQYLQLLDEVLRQGEERDTRSMPTRALFGRSMRFDLRAGFPLLTTKKLHWKSIVHELLWIISGSTNIRPLTDNGVNIWNEWADDQGELGPVYGKQWRAWQSPDGTSVDQLAGLIEGLRSDPFSRRHILSAWNPADLAAMALPPCHLLVQCWVDADGMGLRTQLYQRSADLFLGVPFNIASYSLLTLMLAQLCGMEAREFVWRGGDIHLYQNQWEVAEQQIERTPGALPRVTLNSQIDSIDAFRYQDIHLHDYHPQPHLKAEVIV